LIVISFGGFKEGIAKWKMKKTKIERKGLLTEESRVLLQRLQELMDKKPTDKIY